MRSEKEIKEMLATIDNDLKHTHFNQVRRTLENYKDILSYVLED